MRRTPKASISMGSSNVRDHPFWGADDWWKPSCWWGVFLLFSMGMKHGVWTHSCLVRQMSCDRMSNFQDKAYQLQLPLPHGSECGGTHLVIAYTCFRTTKASSRGLQRNGISLQIVAVTWVSPSYQAYRVGQSGQETTEPASCLQVVCKLLKEQQCHCALQLWLAESIWANAELIRRPNSKVQQRNHNNHRASSCNTATGTCNTSSIPHQFSSSGLDYRTQSSGYGRNTIDSIDQGPAPNLSDFGSIGRAVQANAGCLSLWHCWTYPSCHQNPKATWVARNVNVFPSNGFAVLPGALRKLVLRKTKRLKCTKCTANLHNASVILHVCILGEHSQKHRSTWARANTHSRDGRALGRWCSSRSIFVLMMFQCFVRLHQSPVHPTSLSISPCTAKQESWQRCCDGFPRLITGSCCIVVLLSWDKMILNHVDMGIILWELESMWAWNIVGKHSNVWRYHHHGWWWWWWWWGWKRLVTTWKRYESDPYGSPWLFASATKTQPWRKLLKLTAPSRVTAHAMLHLVSEVKTRHVRPIVVTSRQHGPIFNPLILAQAHSVANSYGFMISTGTQKHHRNQ